MTVLEPENSYRKPIATPNKELSELKDKLYYLSDELVKQGTKFKELISALDQMSALNVHLGTQLNEFEAALVDKSQKLELLETINRDLVKQSLDAKADNVRLDNLLAQKDKEIITLRAIMESDKMIARRMYKKIKSLKKRLKK
jgi:hypothetical protein